MYKNNYILKLFQYMGVGIWGKKHNFIHSQRFKTIIKQQHINIIESKTDSLLDMQSRDSLRNGKVLQSKIVCHTTALAEVSSLESKQDLDSKKDISSTAQYDKVLESKQNLISKQNLESCNFAPLRPTPTHLDKNLESKNCHIERSEISSQDSKKDFSLSLKMTKKQEIKNIKVKAVVLCLFSCMFYAKMSANGFKIQEQSLNATALSSAYVAGARGADASYYNPANMGFKNDWGENKHEFEFAFSLINIPGFKFQVPTTNQGLSSVTYMEYGGLVGTIKPLMDKLGIKLIPGRIELQHTKPDTAMVDGSTGDTNFMLPKFFYKSKNYNGFTFGASFIAPSGLAMKWNGLGGEFLQDVFIFLIEFAPSISYTYRDRISIGFAPRLLYGMGKFNNIVYVPLGTAQEQNKNPTDDKLPEDSTTPGANQNCTPSFNPDILQSLPDGLIPPDMAGMFEALINNPVIFPLLGLPPNATELDAIKVLVSKIQTCLVGTAQVVQKSDGSDIGFGYRASVSARVGDGGMFSVVYNSPVAMQFKGKVSADTIIGGPVGSVRMDAPLYLYVTMPEILTIAYSHDWTFKNKHKLRLEATYERTFWSRGRKFDTEFGWSEAKFTASPGSVPESFSQEQLMGMVGLADFTAVAMGNGWVDTHTFRVGATYITKRLRLMLSAAYDKAPVPQTAIGIPDSNGYMIGLGAKYNFRDFDVGVSLSNTFKDSSSSIYASGGVGQLRIATFSLGYRW
ncbi:MAG: outer membrane protein transport protein [Helicobacter sp.]|uniref:OmpP1/FadL family transporter n=1 Tax=Helicobacter sp. TaxID=218 RepID=UPI002A90EC0F|nr:outer membrane protein transport protein [Helicobacter sp.]MDY5951134.1 outer membrane protein transport protein [Helicobacter sp.]